MQIKAKLLLPLLLTILCSFVGIPETANHQVTPQYPKDYFRAPLDIPIQLSGTFGELRTNHFHAGLDIKTGGQENLSIYAVAEGYVSRIKVSPKGYGNALYIDHPNGFTSVYAHLNKFTGDIGKYIKKRQYEEQEFALDITVPPHFLNVQKSQVVAKSGNTGSSGGPHLHFEIRDTQTEEALNPLLFGIAVKDNVKPQINQIATYHINNENQNYKKHKIYTVKRSNGVYKPSVNVIKVGSTKVGLGIKAYDKQTGMYHLNGIYSLNLLDNGMPIYSFEMDRIAFDESRYINCHIDYPHKKRGGGLMQKCFKEPGNQLTIYEDVVNQGLIDLSDGALHKITYEVKDVVGNTSTAAFMLQYDATQAAPNWTSDYTKRFPYDLDNEFQNSMIRVYFPYGTFYNNLDFQYKLTESTKKSVFSTYHELHNNKTPVHNYFDVSIKPLGLPSYLYEKALIVYKTSSKGKARAVGGEWDGEMLKAKSREFGTYYITADTIAPSIKAINIYNGKVMSKNTTISMNIYDGLSGIKSYDAYIDGEWILMNYDKKSGRLRYYFDERVPKGKHEFKLVVVDERDNEKTYVAKFTR